LEGKHVILNADVLNKRYQSARFQLLHCTGGFGCNRHRRAIGNQLESQFDGMFFMTPPKTQKYNVKQLASGEFVIITGANTFAEVAANVDANTLENVCDPLKKEEPA
jgi:hypothetical protein